jgi:hypothetical protein
MRQWGALAVVALLAAGCAATDARPAYYAETSEGGPRVLVVGVGRQDVNLATVEEMAREFAFGLARRGRAAVDLSRWAADAQAAGRPLPGVLLDRLAGGTLDPEVAAGLRAEAIAQVVFLEVRIYDQVWGVTGKRTRVGIEARGSDLADREKTWYAYAAPEVEDEPGRGFQLGSETAVAALLRVINGEPEPVSWPRWALRFFRW